MRWWVFGAVVLALGWSGCDGDAPTEDAGEETSADASVTSDAGSIDDDGGAEVDAGSVDAGPSGPGRVPMFIAQGMIGRSIISCDDGRTWIADRSFDTEGDALVCGATSPSRCFESPACPFMGSGGCTDHGGDCDCGHHPGFSKGIVFGGDAFVATWGWGHPGTVRRTTNGVDWEIGLEGEWGFGGIAYGAGHYLVSSRSPWRSADGGTWQELGEADFRSETEQVIWSVRSFGYGDYDGGRFVAFASGGGRDVLVSSDAGQSWWRPSSVPADCAVTMNTYGTVLFGNGTFVAVDHEGNACRSTDGGDTWSVAQISDAQVVTTAVWDGAEFLVWAGGQLHRSPDGAAWTATDMTTPMRLAAVARSDAGTFVGTGSFWEGYESQRFYRSEDGLAWEELPSGAFTGGHPIFHIAFGYAEPSALCPLP